MCYTKENVIFCIMITYRMATQPTQEPSVRFYKIIAVTFLLLTVILLGLIVFMTSKKALITVVAKSDVKKISLSVSVSPNPAQDDAVKGTVTAVPFKWSEVYHPTGNKVVDGISKGKVTVHNTSSAPQTLIKTTRVLAASGVLFHLADKIIVPAGGQTTVAVYADQPGATSDIGPSKFTIPGLSPDKQKVIYAESTDPMSGGQARLGVLSADDLKAASTNFKEKMQAAFADTQTSSTVLDTKAVVAVASESDQADHKVGDEVTDFTVSGTSTMIVVTYANQDLAQLVSRQISEKTDPTTEKFLGVDTEPQVSVASYDLKNNTAQLSVYQDAQVTLDANVDALSPAHFFGKSKEEIQRYILGLDHVADVQVKFSPSWMLSAPSVPDRISVVVKNIN